MIEFILKSRYILAQWIFKKRRTERERHWCQGEKVDKISWSRCSWLTVNSWHLKVNTEGSIWKQNSLFLSKDFRTYLATSRSLFSMDILSILVQFGQPLANVLNPTNASQNFFYSLQFRSYYVNIKSSHKLKGAASTIYKKIMERFKRNLWHVLVIQHNYGESYAKQIKHA